MSLREPCDVGAEVPNGATPSDEDLLTPLLRSLARKPHDAPLGQGVVIGELLALAGEERAPVVRFDGHRGSRGLLARSSIELGASHIGQPVLLAFERSDPMLPIVIGTVQNGLVRHTPAPVLVEADGRRLLVDAREQLVLRCGKASITLTAAGKVIIDGTYVLSRSTGVNRLKGGSVQLN